MVKANKMKAALALAQLARKAAAMYRASRWGCTLYKCNAVETHSLETAWF
jgi:hypothetical protein